MKSNVVHLVDEKACGMCEQVKPIAEFHNSLGRHGGVGITNNCQPCRTVLKKASWKAKRDAGIKFPNMGQRVDLIEGGRVCLECEQGKTWDQFSNDQHGYNGKQAKCTDCKKKTRKPDLRQHNYKARPSMVMWKYGVTYQHVIQTLADQHGRCANKSCGKEIFLDIPKGKTQGQIDHDHKTGKFRAVLCVRCNTLAGRLENDQHIVDGLMDYLAKHRTGD